MQPANLRSVALVLLLAATWAAAGCGAPAATPALAPSPTPTPSPADIARQAGERMLAVDSLHFRIALSGKLAYLDDPPMLALKGAEGDVVRPDQVRATATISAFGIIAQLGVVGLGDEQYLTNPLNQQWERVTPEQGWYFNPALLFDRERGLEAVIRDTPWRFASTGTADDDDHYLQAEVSGAQISALTFGMVTSGRVAVEMWVGREDGYARQIQIVELDSDPAEPTTWLIELSDFDQPVVIEPPPLP